MNKPRNTEAKALKEEISSAEGPVADAVLESINDNAYKFLLQSLKDRTFGRLICACESNHGNQYVCMFYEDRSCLRQRMR